jgi:hypothetical protein
MNVRHRLCFAMALGVSLFCTAARSADPGPNPDLTALEKKASDLVRLLGSDSFAERENANQQLEELGLAAKSALEKGAKDDDAEISRRCRELLPAVLEIDLKKRIAAFLADKEGKARHDIPLWAPFQKVVGEDAPSRALFGEMLQGETLSFLLDCADSPDRQGDLLEKFARRAQQKMYQPLPGKAPGQLGKGDWAAILFIGGDAKGGAANGQAPNIMSGMLYQPFARTALTDGPEAPALRKLLVRWMNNQTNENVILQLTQSVQNLQLKEANDFLLNVVRDKKVRGIYMAQVVINVGRLKNKDHIPLLQALLEDQTQLGQIQFGQMRGNTELRDVALAMLVHITDQAHKDYGFSFLTVHPNLLWAPNYLGFTKPEEREAAHKKWKAWWAAQKK